MYSCKVFCKEILLWEEKNLIGRGKNGMKSIENTECGLTGNMLNENAKNLKRDITKISGIYKIINKDNGKYYVGSSENILGKRGRWEEHIRLLKNNKHHNSHLQNAWNKYGQGMFYFIIIKEVEKDRLFIEEQTYLDIARLELNKCYNLSFIADRPEITHRTRQLIREKSPRYGPKNGMYGVHKFYGTPMKDKKGKKNPSYNHTLFSFFNEVTRETFNGTKREFSEKYNIHIRNIHLLTNGKWKSTFGWILRGVKNV